MTRTVTRAGLLLLLLSGALVGSMGLATADNVTYYNNSSGVVTPDSPTNATLPNIVELAVSLSPSLIGTGERDPSGTGFQGVLLTGIVFAGVTVAAMAGTSVGSIGGTILGATVAYGLVDAGFAPPWVKPLLLFGIGTLAFVMFKRIFNR